MMALEGYSLWGVVMRLWVPSGSFGMLQGCDSGRGVICVGGCCFGNRDGGRWIGVGSKDDV